MRGRKNTVTPSSDGLVVAPDAPDWLSDEAAAEWDRVTPGLVERRAITVADLGTLENYAMAVGEIRRARATIAREGDTIVGPHGPKRHPAFQTLFQSLTESRRLAAELGLSPASRQKFPEAAADDDDASALGF